MSTAQQMLLRVSLPEEIVQVYEREAVDRGVSLEVIISERLTAATHHTATKPLYFDDAQRQELEGLVGKNLSTTRDAMVQLRNMVSVRIQGVKIGLKSSLLTRLKSRCLGMKWEAFLEKLIVEDLERYVGMR